MLHHLLYATNKLLVQLPEFRSDDLVGKSTGDRLRSIDVADPTDFSARLVPDRHRLLHIYEHPQTLRNEIITFVAMAYPTL